MPIGYYNFSPIQQGNQQVVNSLASLGQQISGAIENHAQTQAATAMLPALQQSYQQGMKKIASGDPNGMADIYGAASTASQIPILAPFAQHALSTAQSANINAQHMARTQAFLTGRNNALQAKYGADVIDPNTGMVRAGWTPPSTTKGITPYQQAQLDQRSAGMKAKQVGLYSNLWNGLPAQGNDPASEGASSAYNNIISDISNGKAPSQSDLSKFAGAYSQYLQTRKALGSNGIQDQNFENAYQKIQGQIPALNNLIKTESGKGTDHILGGIFGTNTDPAKVNALKQQIEEIQSMGGAKQNAKGGASQDEMLQQAVDAIRKKPSIAPAVRSRLQENGVDPSLLDAAFKSQQSGQPQSVPQTSSMLPAVNSIADTGQSYSPEEQDESEAVGGNETEEEGA